MLRQVLAAGSLVAAYAGYHVMSEQSTELCEAVARRADLVAWNRRLMATISQCASYGVSPENMEELIALVSEMHAIDCTPSLASQGKLARAATLLQQRTERIAACADNRTQESYMHGLYVSDTLMPQIRGIVDDIVINHINRCRV